MSTVLILGASSPTAQAFIKMMNTEYSDVHLRLFVRNINKLPMEQRHKFDIIIGDGSNYEDYVRALVDVDYIYNSIGGLGTGEYTPILIKAIKDTKTNIKHVVDISAGGIYGEYLSGDNQYLSAVRTMYPEYTQNQLNKLSWYKKSGLDFTIFRPGLIKNGPETSVVTHDTDYRKIGENQFNINRATLARAAINALFNNKYDCESLSVSNGKSA
ncbi:NAD(P)-binding oxidoreductase [Companilactobacillus sp.]|uniref:NAD(P)-binding oxidoreductase n=1 Tax=Companilactobacillus sp. TaxID=2767905 RepID=UPI0025BAB173|nr:NAD(P)-binding oxidoreductase [Companilactobacillus sp.]MCH4008660.1 SDR family oxidoreductase [Companilactobacillus sp.]MCH4051161.1 SDR family oxidoreductase [Companilactobacillus sp.]MCH4076603.1 SDR family oxidoreductase [Companilactobacillus sp.]MCH4125178.1 SDR family oxidoreductase [Companilactobacillus sp.]MCH4131718.1 SDR family oxidoreductase [Companilactobacillus sp.]